MYLDTRNKTECFGCEGCVQICAQSAIQMEEDEEGFRYPFIDSEKCINCGLCRKTCPYEHTPMKDSGSKYVYGGYSLDPKIRFESTSGGAFSAIVETFCDYDYAIFGAEAKGLTIEHGYITDILELGKFRKSKYLQSIIGSSYKRVKKFLNEGRKVLFSGTPCQIAGLLSFLNVSKVNTAKLLTVEVVCEGVPSPLYIRKMEKELEKKYGAKINALDYRYTGKSLLSSGTWDFQKMKIQIGNGVTKNSKCKELIKDRWFNPFWSIWLQHLMSRPSCYKCPFTTKGRVADITLGDLWGVHIYCPDLYGKNGGSSLVVCNTKKGKEVMKQAQYKMYGHKLQFEDALKYQSPMRKQIEENPDRVRFIKDLQSDMSFGKINKMWAKSPTIKLLFQKYIWGNRQKVILWNIIRRIKKVKNNA